MRSISGKAMCRILERSGWTLARINGSHHIYIKPGQPQRITVPVHGNRDLKRGLFAAVLKLAGLNEADIDL